MENENKISHLEDLIIIWLDAIIDSNDTIWSKHQSLLRNYLNAVCTLNKINKCLEYIHNIHDEHIFLIVSGSFGEIIIQEIHDLSKICEIYSFCYDINKHSQWSKPFTKIHGIFNDEDLLLKCLEKDIKMYSNTLMPINIAQFNERSLQDINEEQVKFIWFKLMIEVLYRLPQNLLSRK